MERAVAAMVAAAAETVPMGGEAIAMAGKVKAAGKEAVEGLEAHRLAMLEGRMVVVGSAMAAMVVAILAEEEMEAAARAVAVRVAAAWAVAVRVAVGAVAVVKAAVVRAVEA